MGWGCLILTYPQYLTDFVSGPSPAPNWEFLKMADPLPFSWYLKWQKENHHFVHEGKHTNHVRRPLPLSTHNWPTATAPAPPRAFTCLRVRRPPDGRSWPWRRAACEPARRDLRKSRVGVTQVLLVVFHSSRGHAAHVGYDFFEPQPYERICKSHVGGVTTKALSLLERFFLFKISCLHGLLGRANIFRQHSR